MPDRLLKWSLELSEFDIPYESTKAFKAQVPTNFVEEMTSSESPTTGTLKWTIFVDGASILTKSGACIILENEEGIIVEVSLTVSFLTSKNHSKYEAFLSGLCLTDDVGAQEVKIFTDSHIPASQVRGEYQAKKKQPHRVLDPIQREDEKFRHTEVEHVPREHHTRANILYKLASTWKKGRNKSVIQENLSRPSIKNMHKFLT